MLISRKHKKVVLKLKNPERVTTVIPTAKVFEYKGAPLVAVPHRLDETRVLRNLGINAPSPIKYHYPWSGQYAPFHAQRETCDFLTLNPKSFVLNDMGCVDADTEYLSPQGWVRMADYTGGQVAQYVPETGAAEFVEPTEYVKLPCPEMICVKTKYGVDQLLSPEHRVLLRAKSDPSKTEVLSAAALMQRHDAWLIQSSNKGPKSTIGWSQAAIPVTFEAPPAPGVDISDAALRVQVAVIADGHFPNKSNSCVVRLKKARKIERLRSLLDAAHIAYRERESQALTAQGFHVFSFSAPMRVKEFDARFWSASREQLLVIASEVMHWDGSMSSDKPTSRFSTKSRMSADFVQYVYSSTGRTARVTQDPRDGCYEVLVRDNGKPLQVCSATTDGTKRPVMSVAPSTDGFKYCFMVPSTFLIFRRNGCVFASGNTGKTLSVLWAFDYLRQQGLARKMLIVSPLSTLERTWADEVFRHFPHLTTAVLYGTKERRLKLLKEDVDIFLVNHDGIKVIEKELVGRTDIDTICVDEIASFRNGTSGRWKSLRKICDGRDRVWGLTGTPTPNLPTDAWAQVRLIAPERVPPYFGKFRDSVMRQMGPFKWLPREGATEIVAEAMQPAVRFTRDECVDLPPCIYQDRQGGMTPEQAAAYKNMAAKLKMEFESQQVTAVNEAVKMQKLIQIACGVVYDSSGNDVILPNDPRIAVVREVIEEAGSKVIVFVPFKGVLRHVAAQLAEDYTVEMISGDTSPAERAKIFGAFQRTKNPHVLVAQPAAMSHGLTLTEASTIIWYAPVTSNEVYQQANARITRPGQKHTQFIVNIEATEVERRIYNRLKNKQSMQGLLLETVRA